MNTYDKENENLDENIMLSPRDMQEFLDFLNNNGDYVNNGLGAFHTDAHSNW